jgi:hypothetical protein
VATDSGRTLARYRMRNRGAAPHTATLYLAVRPFQVNPPTQFLNTTGGAARVRTLESVGNGGFLRINGEHGLLVTNPDAFGVVTRDQGSIVEWLRRGVLPEGRSLDDSTQFASGALSYRTTLPPGGSREVVVEAGPAGGWTIGPASNPRLVIENAARAWEAARSRVSVKLPPSAAEIQRTLEAQIAYVLINRDGPAIQPGSRSYERSWIRDGALTSSALLRLGHTEEVREFVEWFAGNQFASGKVPCCVDHRGPDPVPEHDSSGEFIFLVAEYLRLGGERSVAERLWPRVQAAAAYLDTLRASRRTPEFKTDSLRHFYGLLPPSISHEGYSAKPMHSYWDDLFALRGFDDAVWLADTLGMPQEAIRLKRSADEFALDLRASIIAAMKVHKIDYVPGAADLGDFDATSTTIALSPVQADGVVPDGALRRTFERYWAFFVARRDGLEPWDAYTPYELRNVGAFVRLGWRDRANEALAWFMEHRRPAGWAHWAEVVSREERAPRFIGDMPHTWVGTDYVRSVLEMIAYERESDDALVLGAGVPESWLRDGGLEVRGLVTRWGKLDFSLRRVGRAIEARIDGVKVPMGGIVLAAPGAGGKATVDGDAVTVTSAGEVVVKRLPAVVRISSSSASR